MFLNTRLQQSPSGLALWSNNENTSQTRTAHYRRCGNYSCYFVQLEHWTLSRRELGSIWLTETTNYKQHRMGKRLFFVVLQPFRTSPKRKKKRRKTKLMFKKQVQKSENDKELKKPSDRYFLHYLSFSFIYFVLLPLIRSCIEMSLHLTWTRWAIRLSSLLVCTYSIYYCNSNTKMGCSAVSRPCTHVHFENSVHLPSEAHAWSAHSASSKKGLASFLSVS